MRSTGEGGGGRAWQEAGGLRHKVGTIFFSYCCFEWSCKRVQKLVDEGLFLRKWGDRGGGGWNSAAGVCFVEVRRCS